MKAPSFNTFIALTVVLCILYGAASVATRAKIEEPVTKFLKSHQNYLPNLVESKRQTWNQDMGKVDHASKEQLNEALSVVICHTSVFVLAMLTLTLFVNGYVASTTTLGIGASWGYFCSSALSKGAPYLLPYYDQTALHVLTAAVVPWVLIVLLKLYFGEKSGG